MNGHSKGRPATQGASAHEDCREHGQCGISESAHLLAIQHDHLGGSEALFALQNKCRSLLHPLSISETFVALSHPLGLLSLRSCPLGLYLLFSLLSF